MTHDSLMKSTCNCTEMYSISRLQSAVVEHEEPIFFFFPIILSFVICVCVEIMLYFICCLSALMCKCLVTSYRYEANECWMEIIGVKRHDNVAKRET